MYDVELNGKIADGKKAWVAPVVRRINAGDAESGFPGANQDAPFVQSS